MLYRKSDILGLSFLDPKDLCLPNQLSKAFCEYILNLVSKKKLGSFNDIINTYFKSFICLPPVARYEHFLASASLSKYPWHFWTEFSQSWNNLRKNIMKPRKPLIIDRSKWCYHWFSFKFKRLVILSVHNVFKDQTSNNKRCAVLASCVNNILYLHKK